MKVVRNIIGTQCASVVYSIFNKNPSPHILGLAKIFIVFLFLFSFVLFFFFFFDETHSLLTDDYNSLVTEEKRPSLVILIVVLKGLS